MIQKTPEVNLPPCTYCQGIMRVIRIIENQIVINKILRHLGLWQTNQRPPPKPIALELRIDYSESQIPFFAEALIAT